jgi:RimJ/RimL family protein N-acetyltransferase
MTSRPVVVGSLLFGADELVGEMVKSRIPHMRTLQWGSFQALGVVRHGQLVGGVVYHHYRGFDIQIAAAFDAKSWALPGTLRALCAYPFVQLGVTRVTAITGKKNKKARRTLERIGFALEGVAKRGLDGVEDAMIFGLLKDNCKWLKDKDHGIRIETTASA